MVYLSLSSFDKKTLFGHTFSLFIFSSLFHFFSQDLSSAQLNNKKGTEYAKSFPNDDVAVENIRER